MYAQRTSNYRRRAYAVRRGTRPQWERNNLLYPVAVAATTQSVQSLYTAAKPIKVTKMRVQVNFNNSTAAGVIVTTPLYYAVVIVPDGYSPNTISTGGGQMYEPSQMLIACGQFVDVQQMYDFWVPTSRRLKEGDSIQFILANSTAYNLEANIIFSYTQIE